MLNLIDYLDSLAREDRFDDDVWLESGSFTGRHDYKITYGELRDCVGAMRQYIAELEYAEHQQADRRAAQ